MPPRWWPYSSRLRHSLPGTFSPGYAAVRFVWAAAGGIGFGLLVGVVMRWVQSHLDDPPIQITISLLTPFVAYLPAERLHASGVLATVAAGIFLGWHSPLMISRPNPAPGLRILGNGHVPSQWFRFYRYRPATSRNPAHTESRIAYRRGRHRASLSAPPSF